MRVYVILLKGALQKVQGSALIKRLRSRSGLSNDWRNQQLFIDLVGKHDE